MRYHRAAITVVSDGQAAWAERLLWQSGKVWLDSPPINKGLKWEAPTACTAGARHVRRAYAYAVDRTEGKRRQARKQRRGGIVDILAKWWR